MNKQKTAKIMLSVSMIIFGTLGIFTRNIGVTSGELALYRAILAALLLAGYFLVTKQKIEFKAIKKELVLLLLSGVAMGINWILLFEAYKYTTISAATLSYYFAPVIVTVACPILFCEKLTKKQILCFILSTIGLVLIIGMDEIVGGAGISESNTHLRGILLGLGAAVFYATVILLNKFIKKVEGIKRTFLQFIAAIITLLPYVACTGGVQLGVLDTKGLVSLLIVGLIHTGITYCMYFSALKELNGQEVAILSYLDPLVAVIISVAVLGEEMKILQLIGGILILGCTLWNELKENLDK